MSYILILFYAINKHLNLKKTPTLSLPKIVGYALHQVSYVSPKRAGDLALHLFGRPQAGRHLPAEKIFLDSATHTHNLPFEEGKVVVHEWNADQPEGVLLLHSWESNAARWQPLIEQLRRAGKRVLSVDAPAQGASSGELFNRLQYSQVIDLLVQEFRPKALVGHSIGGGAVALYLHDHPDTVVERAARLGVPSELRHMANTFARILGLSARMRRSLEQRLKAQYDLTFEQVIIAEYCKSIQIPMLVVHDEQDSIAPIADAHLYHKNLKQGSLLITQGLGHSLQGKEVNQSLVDFLV